MKKCPERSKHCALGVVRWSQNFCPAADPVHGGAGCSKFGAAGAYYLHLQTQFGED